MTCPQSRHGEDEREAERERVSHYEQVLEAEHANCYGVPQFTFHWGTVTHIGIWACGGTRKDLPPVLVGITLQVPQPEPEEAWWCCIGPRPIFRNENAFGGEDYQTQVRSIPTNITRNM
jgi:hypothetical protein